MIKTETRNESKYVLPMEYPKLMRSDDLVVLFTSDGVGTVINQERCNEFGDHSSEWGMYHFTDCDEFEIFELSNLRGC